MNKVQSHRATELSVASWVIATAMLGGCVGADAGAASGELRSERQSIAEYERQFEATPTLIGPRAAIERQMDTADVDVGRAATVIDAREGRTIFPVPDRMRTFRDDTDLTRFVAAELGVDSIQSDERGNPVGWTGSYAMLGTAYWTDEETGVRYRVADPTKAFLGGVTGEIRVGEEVRCLDLDGRCSAGERASYLEPEGEVTKPTHVTVPGTSGVSALLHTFYNKVPIPFWARHGSNAGINVAPLPDTFAMTGGECWQFIGTTGMWSDWPFPAVGATNVQRVETAVWTGLPANAIYDALAACGSGIVNDFDVVTGSVFTGNGPSNNTVCGL